MDRQLRDTLSRFKNVNRYDFSKRSDVSAFERRVNNDFDIGNKRIKRMHNPQGGLKAIDRDGLSLKKRKQAVIHAAEYADRLFAERYPDLCIPDELLRLNCAPVGISLDYCDELEFTSVAAALWILDRLQEAGTMSKAFSFFPDRELAREKAVMPPMSDTCHSDDVILGVLYIIQHINVENDQTQMNPRKRFREIMKLIDLCAIKRAVKRFEDKQWENFDAVLRGINYHRQRLLKLVDEALPAIDSCVTVSGKPVWSKNGIKAMLTNEKYVGDVMYQKTFREDCISKKTKINRGEIDRYLVTDNHPAIIDRETFRLVKRELVKRSSKRRSSSNAITELGKYSGKYALSELLVCDVCGSPYRRKTWTRNGVKKVYWRCLNHLENGNDACPQTKGIEEILLQAAICRGLTKCIPETSDVKGLVRTMLAYATSEDEALLECQTMENTIKELQSKANEAEEMCIRTEGDKRPYMEQIKKYYASIAQMRERVKGIKKQIEQSEEYQADIAQIDKWLGDEEVSFAEFDDDIVRYLVDSVRATDDQKIIITVKGGATVTEELLPMAG